MRVINFLPDDYLRRRSMRRANLACAALAAGTLLVLAAVVGLIFLRAAGAAGMRQIVEAQYAEASRQIDQLKQLEERKTGLLHKVELSSALLERVPRSHLLACVTNYLPTGTSLTSVTMQAIEVDVKVEAKPEDAKPPAPGVKAAPKGPAPRVKRVQFRLDGLAPTDVEVAEFISRLGRDPLFEQVDLQFSEAHPIKDKTVMRRFQLCFRLNPKSECVLEAPPATAAASAQAVKGNS